MATDPVLLALRLLGQDFALEPGREYVVGSGRDCDLRLDGPDVAPHHARLRVGEGEVEILDLGSAAGTHQNGARIERTRLEVGDALQFGDGAAELVRDDGQALIVPIPEMVAGATRRRRRLAVSTGAVRRFEEKVSKNSGKFRINVHWQAIHNTNNRIVAEINRTSGPIDEPFDLAMKSHLGKTIESAAVDLSEQLANSWKTGALGSSVFLLVFNGKVNYSDLEKIKSKLRSQSKAIKSVRERLFSPEKIILETDISVSGQVMSTVLSALEFEGFSLKVSELNESKAVLDFTRTELGL